jgi:lipoprotein signal peptidase
VSPNVDDSLPLIPGDAIQPTDRPRLGARAWHAVSALTVAAIVAVSVAKDRAVAHNAGTFHHARPLVVVAPGLLLAAYVWRARARFPRMAQAGIVLCASGAAANFACLILDPSGVSDYIDLRAGAYLIVLNIADIALISGLVVVTTSVVARLLSARMRSTRGL